MIWMCLNAWCNLRNFGWRERSLPDGNSVVRMLEGHQLGVCWGGKFEARQKEIKH
jgi:hypothetical protein